MRRRGGIQTRGTNDCLELPYVISSDADKLAYDALLALRVPAEYKDVHVQLVLAFGQMVAGEDVAGKARLDDVMQVYPWTSPVFN